MTLLLLLARLLLAIIFVVAGLAKLADLAGSRQALRDFGVPAPLATPFGVLLPLAELAVAIALLPTRSVWWGALGALVLLLLFVSGIGYNLARGRQPNCHCFGQLHSAPAGWPTLIRNGVLAAGAGSIVWFGPGSADPNVLGWFGALALTQRLELLGAVVAAALLAGESWLLFQVLSQQGRVLVRVEALEAQLAAQGVAPQAASTGKAAPAVMGLPVGTPAPTFVLSTLTGERLTLEALRSLGKPVVLLFADPGCGPCNALLPEVGRWQREYASNVVLALISRGTADANRPKVTEYGLTHVLLQQDREIAQAYEVSGTPSAVLIRRDGTIGSPLAAGADAIGDLISRALSPLVQSVLPMAAPLSGNGHAAGPAQPVGPKVGEPAPELRLPDLEGKVVDLADFRGRKTLVLFWNPGCGFCQRMLADLKAWEARPPEGAPKLLVVSTGTVEANQEMGLHSSVLLDQGFSIGRQFGATGTPAAVLVDAEGKIASEVATGAPTVLALAGFVLPTIGDPAPAFSLPNLSGEQVSLSDFAGSQTLVLFWNPGCGFCQRMLADLKAWEASPAEGAPKLLVVSTGTVEVNQEMGLHSSVLLDEDFSIGKQFGASGTPMAVLIDAQGKIASEVAAGASAVLALTGSSQHEHQVAALSR